MSIKKVLVVTTAFPRWQGDSRAPFIFEAARSLVKKDFIVKVLAMHNPGAKNYEMMGDIPVYRPSYLPARFELLQNESGGIPQAIKKNRLSLLLLVPFFLVHTWMLIRLAKDVDVIHANWTLSGAAAVLSKWIHHKPIIVTVQGSDIFEAPKMGLIKRITRIVLSNSDRVIALSTSLFKETVKLGVASNKIVVIPNGVNIDDFTPGLQERDPIILFVGSLIDRKGVKYLIEARKLLQEKWPESKLVIIGEGSNRNDLQHLVNTLDLSDKIAFLGAQPQSVVSMWMRRSKIFVLPSLEEGLGVVLLEALASATPCVGSNTGGIPDIITPEIGFLTTPADSQDLASSIWNLVKDQDFWNLFSVNARARAESTYSWRNIGEQILAEYELVAAKENLNA